MRCCSIRCEKRHNCSLHYLNSFGTYQIEDFSTFGSGGIGDVGTWWCGSLGNYKMYKPVKYSREEFIAKHCSVCGSQRCEGVDTEWFDGCKFKDELNEM